MPQIIAGLTAIGFVLALFAGYIMNIVWLIKQDITWTIEQSLGVVGVVVPPLGVIMGWLH